MSNTTRKVLITLLLVYILAFGFFVLLSVFPLSPFSFQPSKVLEVFKRNWVLNNSIILFIENLVPIHCAAILLVYSMIVHPSPETTKKTFSAKLFHQIVSSTLVLFLVFTLIYTILAEIFLPAKYIAQDDLEYRTQIAKEFYKNAEDALKENNLTAARQNINLYLDIDPKRQSALGILDTINKKTVAPGDSEKSEAGISKEQNQPLNMTAEQLIAQAETYMKAEDYFSAHYYASRAFQIDGTRVDAKRMASQAWEKIAQFKPDEKDTAKRTLFQTKRDGYDAFMQNDFIKAYYIFNELSKQTVKDPDVQEFLMKSLEEMNKISFFSDEAIQTSHLPGRKNIIFINAHGKNKKEFIHFDKLISVQEGIYVFGIEGIAFGPSWEVMYHFQAPYGKIMKEQIISTGNKTKEDAYYLNMQCLDREKENVRYYPVYLKMNTNGESSNIIRIKPSAETLLNLSYVQKSLKQISITSLWRTGEILEDLGFRKEPFLYEIIARLLKPFSFLVLSILATAIGWRLRSTYEKRRPLLAIVFLPAIPFIIFIISQSYVYANQVIFGFLIFAVGFIIAQVAFFVLQFAFLFISLIFLSGQVTE